MRVQVLPADQGGCRYYRCHLPVLSILQHNDAVDCFMNDELKAIRPRDNPAEIIDSVPSEEDVEVVVLQRPTKRDVVRCIPHLQARGITVVVEIDDDLAAVPANNAAWHKLQPHTSPESNHVYLMKAARMADIVTTSTPALAGRYAQHGRYAVVPNYVDEAWTYVERSSEKAYPDHVTIGWTGHPRMHPHDLEVVGTAMRTVIDNTDSRFYAIGSVDTLQPLGLDGDVADFTDWAPIDHYPQVVKTNLDIGIVPLDDSNFNQAKSWLKGVEYAALGIPFVASPTAEYRALHRRMQEITGHETPFFLAKRPKQWIKYLEALALNEGLREEMGRDLRQAARDHFTIQGNYHQYVSAWSKAYRRRKSIVPELHPQGFPPRAILGLPSKSLL